MKKKMKAFWNWLSDAGAWILLTLSAFVGIAGAGMALESIKSFSHTQQIAQLIFAFGSAFFLVYRDCKRGDDKADKEAKEHAKQVRKKRLGQRVGKMYSAGTAVVVAPAVGWKLITLGLQVLGVK